MRGYFIRQWHKEMLKNNGYHRQISNGSNYDIDFNQSDVAMILNEEEAEEEAINVFNGFEKLYDDSAQAWYWYNEETGEASWTDPSQN